MSPLSANDVVQIITRDETAQLLVQRADAFGKELQGMNLSTSQIRSLFGEVRQIQGEWKMGNDARKRALRRLMLLKPKMAYRAKRESGQAVKTLVEALNPAVDAVVTAPSDKQDEYFDRFVQFFEAILAYHKAYGGK